MYFKKRTSRRIHRSPSGCIFYCVVWSGKRSKNMSQYYSINLWCFLSYTQTTILAIISSQIKAKLEINSPLCPQQFFTQNFLIVLILPLKLQFNLVTDYTPLVFLTYFCSLILLIGCMVRCQVETPNILLLWQVLWSNDYI